jgi:hydroxypyruvate reductase
VVQAGLKPIAAGRAVEGDVAGLARSCAGRALSLQPGEVLVAVGEPTVRLRGGGLGGRSQQLALDVARRIAGTAAAFVALGSDGTDGPTDAAGAVVDGGTWESMERAGADPGRALDENDAFHALGAAGALVFTGPTGTNLLDVHLLASG